MAGTVSGMARSAPRALIAMVLIATWVSTGGAAQARDCTMLLPRADGVLRLDTGAALAVPCGGPRAAYAALPPRPVPPRRPSPAPRPAALPAASPAQQGALPPEAAGDASLHQLQDETTRLKSELSRLNDETMRLRDEAARLGNELARRESGAAAIAPPSVAPAPLSSSPPAGADRSAAAEREFERQKGVVERAWSELIAMATRMRRELGRPE